MSKEFIPDNSSTVVGVTVTEDGKYTIATNRIELKNDKFFSHSEAQVPDWVTQQTNIYLSVEEYPDIKTAKKTIWRRVLGRRLQDYGETGVSKTFLLTGVGGVLHGLKQGDSQTLIAGGILLVNGLLLRRQNRSTRVSREIAEAQRKKLKK